MTVRVERDSRRQTWRKARRHSLAALRFNWREGRACGFPLCCVVRYAWDAWRGYFPAQLRPARNGYVPCGFLHQ